MNFKIENLTARNKQKILFLSLFILHFTLFIIGCSNPSESSKGSLSGTISLEGQEDHSDISVAVYALAYLDTTIVRINSEYQNIGVIINQHTEFDHRLQSPLYQTTTSPDGSFKIKDITTGKYNFVARKDGFGFHYITDMEISKGENHLSDKFKMQNEKCKIKKDVTLWDSENVRNSIEGQKAHQDDSNFKSSLLNFTSNRNRDLTLYPETLFSGNISGEHIFETNHHYIMEDHTSFVPGSRLEIQPGAVVRINPGKDLNIYGNFKARGEMNNMFWVTSNDGFIAEGKRGRRKEENDATQSNPENISLFASPISHRSDEIALYNSMNIYPTAIIEDDLIESGKLDWGNNAFGLTQVANLSMTYLIIRGVTSGLNLNSCNNINVSKNMFQYASNNSFAGIYFSASSHNIVNKNILLDNVNGIQLHDTNNTELMDNYISNCNLGIFNLIHSSSNTFHHNEISSYQTGIFNAGSTISITYNNINASLGIDNSNSYYATNGIPTINFNNLKCSHYAARTTSFFHNGIVYLDAKNNWWNTTNEEEIQALIWDKNDEDPFGPNYNFLNAYYEYIPYRSQKVQNAGIQSN